MLVIAELDDIEVEDRLLLDRAIKSRAALKSSPCKFDPTADEWEFQTYGLEDLDLKTAEGCNAFSQYARRTDLTLEVRSKGDPIRHCKEDEGDLMVADHQSSVSELAYKGLVFVSHMPKEIYATAPS